MEHFRPISILSQDSEQNSALGCNLTDFSHLALCPTMFQVPLSSSSSSSHCGQSPAQGSSPAPALTWQPSRRASGTAPDGCTPAWPPYGPSGQSAKHERGSSACARTLRLPHNSSEEAAPGAAASREEHLSICSPGTSGADRHPTSLSVTSHLLQLLLCKARGNIVGSHVKPPQD